MDAIHAAGGVALCAHAASSFHGPGLAATLLELAKEDFDGFECYHSGHSREDTAALLTYCRQHQLLVSGGSDCHGTRKTHISVGTGCGDLAIPYSGLEGLRKLR